jgi:hypothetical protein
MNTAAKQRKRALLATMTTEPFQPVRLYFGVPDRSTVTGKLRDLECLVQDRAERCWHWLFEAEAAVLQFSGIGYDDIPKEKRPIALGRIRLPENGCMTLQTNSVERAIQGARFLASHLGPDVVALRCRVVNRCFAADEGAPNELMKALDGDVTVIDPRSAEAELGAHWQGVPSVQDAERAAAEWVERKLKSGKDVPPVEDFPLAPEEETPDFHHLATCLRLRFIRAFEHWQGNTHLTLTAIIVRTVEESMRAQGESA